MSITKQIVFIEVFPYLHRWVDYDCGGVVVLSGAVAEISIKLLIKFCAIG